MARAVFVSTPDHSSSEWRALRPDAAMMSLLSGLLEATELPFSVMVAVNGKLAPGSSVSLTSNGPIDVLSDVKLPNFPLKGDGQPFPSKATVNFVAARPPLTAAWKVTESPTETVKGSGVLGPELAE